jgi:hypothetical protein
MRRLKAAKHLIRLAHNDVGVRRAAHHAYGFGLNEEQLAQALVVHVATFALALRQAWRRLRLTAHVTLDGVFARLLHRRQPTFCVARPNS